MLGKIDFRSAQVQAERAFMKHITSMSAPLLAIAVLVGSFSLARAEGLSGKVAETMNAGGYTYVLVDSGTNQVWAAATKFAVKKGDKVTVPDSMSMSNFHSDSLKRDFPLIYFAGNITVNGDAAAAGELPAGHPAVGGELPAGHPTKSAMMAMPKIDFAGLKPLKDGTTVAAIYAGSAKLGGQTVKLRGKVVKYNANILNKNWVHVQDGTGEAGRNDLLVTTTDVAKVGETVLVEGKVALNKDFGAGYNYELLVEEAKVTAE